MRIRHHPHTPAALLLAGIAALYALLGGGGGVPPRPSPAEARLVPVQRPLPAPGSNARKSLDWCRHNVAIIHDLYWASACTVLADEQRRRRLDCLQARSSPGATAPHAPCDPGLEPPDDSPECMLPDNRALALNLARARAEQECLDEATAAAAAPGAEAPPR